MSFLLWAGATGSLLFPIVFLVDGWTRPGYRPMRHPVSALALGARGWIQTTNFVSCGIGIAAGAVALAPALNSVVLAVVIGVLGLSLVASGVFTMDPMRGYPPGTPDDTPADVSFRHTLHDWAGMLVFVLAPLAPVVAVFVVPGVGWKIYSAVTAAVGFTTSGAFGQAWENDHPRTGLIQRATLVTCLIWLGILFLNA